MNSDNQEKSLSSPRALPLKSGGASALLEMYWDEKKETQDKKIHDVKSKPWLTPGRFSLFSPQLALSCETAQELCSLMISALEHAEDSILSAIIAHPYVRDWQDELDRFAPTLIIAAARASQGKSLKVSLALIRSVVTSEAISHGAGFAIMDQYLSARKFAGNEWKAKKEIIAELGEIEGAWANMSESQFNVIRAELSDGTPWSNHELQDAVAWREKHILEKEIPSPKAQSIVKKRPKNL